MASISENEIDENDHFLSNNLNMFQSVPWSFKFLEFRPVNLNPKLDESYAKNTNVKCQYLNMFLWELMTLSVRIKLMVGSTLF